MSAKAAVPVVFRDFVELSSDLTGTFVMYATDDYFAEKENLLKPGAPEWIEGKYTDKGKWMDGWESQRRRTPGHDHCIVRLGTPGTIHGIMVDTTHFRGNAPQEVALEGIVAPYTATADELNASDDWFAVLPKLSVQPHTPNAFVLEEPSTRATHVRLRIYPDGGVARLRIYGHVTPDPRVFWLGGSVDLGAVENGGTVAAESDQFFGPAANLLLPGRGVNMGDGWETKRRRTPGSDWAVIKLARRGNLHRIELDTHFFKGNAPQFALVEAIDAAWTSPEDFNALLRAPEGWNTLVSKTPLVQHRRHLLEPDRPMTVTHVRVHIFPHGGVNRLRLFGTALDTAEESQALAQLNGMNPKQLEKTLLSFNGSKAWAQTMAVSRPFGSVRALFKSAEEIWWSLDTKAWLEAYEAHPRIGSTKKGKGQNQKSAEWSKGEQKGVERSPAEVQARLRELNEKYFKKFGFIYIVFATGKTAPQMLELLEQRVKNSKKQELDNAAVEQAKITKLRIEKWLRAQGA